MTGTNIASWTESTRAARGRGGKAPEGEAVCEAGVTWGLGVWDRVDTHRLQGVGELEAIPKGNRGEFLKGRERRGLLFVRRGTI